MIQTEKKQGRLKRTVKIDPVKKSLVRTPQTLMGGIFFYGKIGCLDENTKILYVRDSEIIKEKIKNLPDDFEVLSFNFKSNEIENKNASKHYSGEKELYEIKFDNGSKILATEDHRFYDKNLKEIKVKDLIKNNKLFCHILLNKLDDNFLKIKSIKKIKVKKRTYDLTVEGNENFFLSNGILSHNSGKTTGLMSYAAQYHDNPHRQYKIWDIWGGKRHEQFWWCIPSQDKQYWAYLKKKLRLSNVGPKQYKCNLLYPVTKKLPDELPALDKFVFPMLFTIPFKDIESDDIKLVVGNISATSETLLEDIKYKAKKTDGPAELIKIVKELGGLNDSIYKNFLYPLIQQRMLSSEVDKNNINFIKQAEDREVISILCLNHLDDKFKLFIMGYFLRKTAQLLDNGRIKKKNIFLIREAAEFFRATERATIEDRFKIFKTQVADYIRMGRRGQHLFMDSQSPVETRGLVDGCLFENTFIKIINNNKIDNLSIKELPINFKVLSYNLEKNKLEKNKAKKINTGIKECYEIEFENGKKVIATEDHRFFDKNKKEIKVNKLKKGDELIFI